MLFQKHLATMLKIIFLQKKGKGMQDDINMYITRGRLNNAGFRQELDPIAKNIFRGQNLLEFLKIFLLLMDKIQ